VPTFSYARAVDVEDAVRRGSRPGVAYIAGGTDILNLLRDEAVTASSLVDLRSAAPARIAVNGAGATISAFATMREVADHPALGEQWPMLRAALLSGASAQVRNMATIGGNLMQRTRCWYFRDPGSPCNKKRPGSGCPAREGEHRWHSVFGASEHCVAVHPSDLAVALAALDGRITVRNAVAERTLGIEEIYRTPGDEPERDTTLGPGDLIVDVFVPRTALAASSSYVKVRDRASFEFALVSCAAALSIADGQVSDVRIALGGVAALPWRARAAEDYLRGRRPTAESFTACGARGTDGAQALPGNRFKMDLIPAVIMRALERAK
jgi:xanthine dehydrogenase YagS FAD-binding subunit